MSRELVKQITAELSAIHEEAMDKLASLKDADLEAKVTYGGRERAARSLLLQIGAHDREHALQIEKTLQWMGRQLTEAQMTLIHAQQARAELLGLLAAINDEDLDRVAKDGEWTVRQTLDHLLKGETRYLAMVLEAVKGK